MGLLIDIVTLFPGFFDSPLRESLLKKAQEAGKVQFNIHNLRDYTHDRHKTADEKPYGGGAGMLMKPEPIFECVEAIQKKPRSSGRKKAPSGWVVLLDARGEKLTPAAAMKLAARKRLILVAGHYEGIDARVHQHLADQVISVGDFITMGGEAPALCLIEAVTRFVPGVLGNQESLQHESFHRDLLEYPQYTRPRDFRGWKVPEVLMSGHHSKVETWRAKQALAMTQKQRPDLLKKKKKK